LIMAILWAAFGYYTCANGASGPLNEIETARIASPTKAPPGNYIHLAEHKRFKDYWEKKESNGWGPTIKRNYNPFLGTYNLYKKIGVFILLFVALYTAFWLIFGFLIKGDRSPQAAFMCCFIPFMLSVYPVAFVCFSEYTLLKPYDPVATYIHQLPLPAWGIGALIWVIFSLLMTFALGGKTLNR
jgi:hypothetical protein